MNLNTLTSVVEMRQISKRFAAVQALANVKLNLYPGEVHTIAGENGSGKELVARWIHEKSNRNANPIVEVNCAAIPSELIESELFGHEKGAFVGADKQHIGRFESANHGTLFLDHITELDLDVQAKLLRVIQDNEFERVGGDETIHIDVRILSTTNRDIYKEIKCEMFICPYRTNDKNKLYDGMIVQLIVNCNNEKKIYILFLFLLLSLYGFAFLIS